MSRARIPGTYGADWPTVRYGSRVRRTRAPRGRAPVNVVHELARHRIATGPAHRDERRRSFVDRILRRRR